MALPDAWPGDARAPEQKHEQRIGDRGDIGPAGAAAESGPGQTACSYRHGTGRFLYPVALIAGALFLIILAAV